MFPDDWDDDDGNRNCLQKLKMIVQNKSQGKRGHTCLSPSANIVHPKQELISSGLWILTQWLHNYYPVLYAKSRQWSFDSSSWFWIFSPVRLTWPVEKKERNRRKARGWMRIIIKCESLLQPTLEFPPVSECTSTTMCNSWLLFNFLSQWLHHLCSSCGWMRRWENKCLQILLTFFPSAVSDRIFHLKRLPIWNILSCETVFCGKHHSE